MSGGSLRNDKTLVADPSLDSEEDVAVCADEDKTLVERIKANDAVAFDELVQKYRKKIYSIIYNMTSNREDAFDLTQDVFIKVYKSIHKFTGKSAFFTWLYRIAVNTTVSAIRRNRFKHFFSLEQIKEDRTAEVDWCELGVDSDAARPVFLKELQENLNVALQKLSNKHRTVVVLCEVEGLSSTEVAAILKCSEGTVRSRLHYAKEQLKNYLKQYLR